MTTKLKTSRDQNNTKWHNARRGTRFGWRRGQGEAEDGFTRSLVGRQIWNRNVGGEAQDEFRMEPGVDGIATARRRPRTDSQRDLEPMESTAGEAEDELATDLENLNGRRRI
ncbi:hypothetical protein TIFTF001_028819 [Ficus carica]|uniref:Uncharacterized protein n=1 Tax=Ficus carica TaxID=3494 RepID=A0AA88DR79_FICCA|nr:hypothetical protein TIFTF001_028819 [Ficus carica]